MADDIQPPFPGEPPTLEPRPEWSALECWVWQAVGQGQPARIDDFLDRKAPDPRSAPGWTVERRLSAAFLQTIAMHEPYLSALPRHGIEIIGAWFDEGLDLRDGRLKGGLWLHRCRFEKEVGFNGLKSESVISLEGSVFENELDMRGLEIEGGLYLRDGARFKQVNLYGSRIGRNASIRRSCFEGRLIMNAVKIGGNLLGFESTFHGDVGLKGAVVDGMADLRRSVFRKRLDMWWLRTGQDLLMSGMMGDQLASRRSEYSHLDCRNAKIGGKLDLRNADVMEDLNLDSITIANEALLEEDASFASINLRLARVGQHLSFATSEIHGPLTLTGAIIGQDVSFKTSTLAKKLDLVFAEIEGNLQLCNGTFHIVDLTGTRIGGELRLTKDKGAIQWASDGQLILRNTRADAIHDTPDALARDHRARRLRL